MLDTIRKTLEYSGADEYQITDELIRSWEFYFIRHKLDQNRVKDVEHINVKVFKRIEGGKYLGSASGEISPKASKEEVKKKITELVEQASMVRNPYYKLIEGRALKPQPKAKTEIAQIARDYIEAIKSVKETAGEDINSYEIFVNEITRRIINSEGVNDVCTYPSSMAEVVVNARKEGQEIELYRMYRSGTCDKDAIVRDLVETMKYGKDKLLAEPTPALNKAPVIFSTSAARSLYQYYVDRLSASYQYQGLSDWKIGKPVCEEVKGDRVTVYAVHELPNSPYNFQCDEEGAVIFDRCLMRENVPENYWGSAQFSYYLDLKGSSIVYNWTVSGGTKSEAELRKGNYLELVEFSDFQVDPMTGDIAGEIRLGYWHEGGKTRIISGGSVSGNMKEAIKEMYLSKESVQYTNAVVPALTRIENLTITGITEQ